MPLVDLARETSAIDREVDVLIIGSGAGGAIVGKELAEGGREVVILEEGGYYTAKDFTESPLKRAARLYRERGLTATLGLPPVGLPLGCSVGGTTTVNSGTCFRTPPDVIETWRREHGLGVLSQAQLDPLYERVEREMKVKPVPDEILGGNGRMTRKGAQALGWSHAPINRNMEGCCGCCQCGFGCPQDAKLGTHLTYIPKAVKAGATLYYHARADRLVWKDHRIEAVEGTTVSEERGPGRPFRIRPKTFVLSAGAVYSPWFLLKNRFPNPSGQIGRNLRVHPGLKVTGYFPEEVNQHRGVLQSYYVDQFTSEGIMMEATGVPPELGAPALNGLGMELKRHMADWPHLATLGVMVSDTSAGRVMALGKVPFMVYNFNRRDARTAGQGLKRGAEVLFAAGAQWIETGYPPAGILKSKADVAKFDAHTIRRRFLQMVGFHPMGTCRMGSDPRTSVVDENLKVHGFENFYIADGSIFPTSLGVNPQITIMTFATRMAFHLLGR